MKHGETAWRPTSRASASKVIGLADLVKNKNATGREKDGSTSGGSKGRVDGAVTVLVTGETAWTVSRR